MHINNRLFNFKIAIAFAIGISACASSNGVKYASSGDAGVNPLTINPSNATLSVSDGQMPPPTMQFNAFLNGQPIVASWRLDRGDVGTISSSSGLFAASGLRGGKVVVTATTQGFTASASLEITLNATQNGGDPSSQGNSLNGVGGNGEGGPVSANVVNILNGATKVDDSIEWLYPYANTVWPQGLSAPLMQWTPSVHPLTAIYIHIVEGTYEYRGYFSANAPVFQNHPIPEKVWDQLTYSNSGDTVHVALTFTDGQTAFGPITQDWKVAQANLQGTVYYQSYGSRLLQNSSELDINGNRFGAATLAITPGQSTPIVVAGANGECRVCHSVAANGGGLVTQHGDIYPQTSYFDLKRPGAEILISTDGSFLFPAVSPDATLLFSNSSGVMAGGGLAGDSLSRLYTLVDGKPVQTTGLPTGLRAATPTFSPDGKHLAFNLYGGTGGDQRSLAMIDFDATQKTFSNLRTLYTPARGTVVWPSFTPDSRLIVFELEITSNGRNFAGTRSNCDDATQACSSTGTRAELWVYDLEAKRAIRLDSLNGNGYLPKGANGHDSDTTLNYEPTVNPIISGGYAWVVFTSRRLYGNVATINPFWSDPRYHDISHTPPTKKLWVASINLHAANGSDPSSPAFYLPGQELLSGNMRGYWSLEPGRTDGSPCQSGDQCQGGYCQDQGGNLTCSSSATSCSQIYEKCTTSQDCCGASNVVACINGICGQSSIGSGIQ